MIFRRAACCAHALTLRVLYPHSFVFPLRDGQHSDGFTCGDVSREDGGAMEGPLDQLPGELRHLEGGASAYAEFFSGVVFERGVAEREQSFAFLESRESCADGQIERTS